MRRESVFLILVLAASVMAQQPSRATIVPSNEDHRSQLLRRLSDARECGEECRWKIADVLGKMKNKAFLLTAFRTANNSDEKLGIIYALYRINDPEVEAFFKQLITEKYDDGEELYYPLNYLAKRCDTDALRVLSGNGKGGYKGYPGCEQWGTTVELFGKCKYKTAIPYLVDSVQAACMNIGIAAVEDLRKMYPGSPNFKHYSPQQIEQYFRDIVAAESAAK